MEFERWSGGREGLTGFKLAFGCSVLMLSTTFALFVFTSTSRSSSICSLTNFCKNQATLNTLLLHPTRFYQHKRPTGRQKWLKNRNILRFLWFGCGFQRNSSTCVDFLRKYYNCKQCCCEMTELVVDRECQGVKRHLTSDTCRHCCCCCCSVMARHNKKSRASTGQNTCRIFAPQMTSLASHNHFRFVA